MLHSKSIKTRFLVSLGGNVLRAVISFITGLCVARGLNPSGYGDFTFLLGSFSAITSLLDMGTSSAFYTFISQKVCSKKYYQYYFEWLGLQFGIPALAIIFVLPGVLMSKIWVGHSRELILLAFVASFMQNQIWLVVGQIAESSRKTGKYQIMNLTIAIIYFSIVIFFTILGSITLIKIFLILIFEYLFAAIWAYWFLKDEQDYNVKETEEIFEFKQMLGEYIKYCKPLIFLAIVTFIYNFADSWMLQRFGGSKQQGYFQISSQFAAVSLLATSSILTIFWKEIADANERKDNDMIAKLYKKVSRGLIIFGAILSGFLIPWTSEIVAVFLGKQYTLAVPVLSIMFLYPVHQSLGQIAATMFMATRRTSIYMGVSISIMLVSLPISYMIQAQPSTSLIPGFGLGALGMAFKMVVLNIISVNVLAWIISRNFKWKFD